MSKVFDGTYKKLSEEFSGYYSGVSTNDLALRTAERLGEVVPEVGDMVQVQVVGNLDPDQPEKTNSSNTYKIIDKTGSKIKMVYCEMIHGDEVETFANPTNDLDSTYLNGTPALEMKVTSELTLDLSKLGKNTFNYMHDKVWTACIILNNSLK